MEGDSEQYHRIHRSAAGKPVVFASRPVSARGMPLTETLVPLWIRYFCGLFLLHKLIKIMSIKTFLFTPGSARRIVNLRPTPEATAKAAVCQAPEGDRTCSLQRIQNLSASGRGTEKHHSISSLKAAESKPLANQFSLVIPLPKRKQNPAKLA